MLKRYKYNLTHQVATYGHMGELVPFLSMDIAPGDTFSGVIGQLTRFSPLKHAVLYDMYIDSFLMYAPNRLLDSGWEDFVTNGPVAAGTTTPTITLAAGGSDDLPWLRYLNRKGASSVTACAYRLRMYNLCFNEYFRDDQESPVGADDIPPTTQPRLVSQRKNYFTTLRDNLAEAESHSAIVTAGSPDTVSAEEILEAIARQKASMRRASYGTRYVDSLRRMGINVNYQMLQRPEIVGIGRTTANVTDVVQTGVDSTDSGLGALSGHAIGGGRLRVKRKTFPEHGQLMGFIVIRPQYSFAGCNEYLDKARPYEAYYDPDLVSLPAVEVTGTDLMNDDDTDAAIGYTPWGEWYRKHNSWFRYNDAGNDFNEWIPKQRSDADLSISSTGELRNPSRTVYNDLFEDVTYGHFQLSSVNKLKALRCIQPKNRSVFPGST